MSCVTLSDHTLTLVVSDRLHEADEYIAARKRELENRETASRAQIDEALNQLDARCRSLHETLHVCG